MTPDDRQLLRHLIGLPQTYPNFRPDEDSGDNGMLCDYLLSAGYSIRIHKLITGPYGCILTAAPDVEVMAEAPDRRCAIAQAALSLCSGEK